MTTARKIWGTYADRRVTFRDYLYEAEWETCRKDQAHFWGARKAHFTPDAACCARPQGQE